MRGIYVTFLPTAQLSIGDLHGYYQALHAHGYPPPPILPGMLPPAYMYPTPATDKVRMFRMQTFLRKCFFLSFGKYSCSFALYLIGSAGFKLFAMCLVAVNLLLPLVTAPHAAYG